MSESLQPDETIRNAPLDAPHAKSNDALLLALLEGRTIAEAARITGLSATAVRRRMANPAFRRELDRLRESLYSECVGRLAGTLMEAVDAARALLASDNDGVKLGAARLLLDMASRWRMEYAVGDRLDALEQALDQLENGPGQTPVREHDQLAFEPEENHGTDTATNDPPPEQSGP